MDKPFKTYRQQLKILRSRNLSIHNGSKAIEVLKREGYYNIINGYKDIFLDKKITSQKNEDWYKNNITLTHIYTLYNFDRNLRLILLKQILIMETTFKTKVAYNFSESAKQNFNYFDINNFDDSDPQRVTKLIAKISNVITNNSEKKDQGGQFFHYLDKHKELPLWVLTKKMTLGEIIHFYKVIQPAIREKIINEIISEYEKNYRIRNISKIKNIEQSFSNMLTFINLFRNICAHEERLYNTLIKRNKKIMPILLFHKQSPLQFNSKLFDCIIILKLFIPKKNYQELIKNISSEIADLSRKLPQNIFNQVLIEMGFKKDWSTIIKLP